MNSPLTVSSDFAEKFISIASVSALMYILKAEEPTLFHNIIHLGYLFMQKLTKPSITSSFSLFELSWCEIASG